MDAAAGKKPWRTFENSQTIIMTELETRRLGQGDHMIFLYLCILK